MSSSVLARIKPASPRDSTFSRTTGSVFDGRTLQRQSGNSRLMPSVSSTERAFAPYTSSSRRMAVAGSANCRLISPLTG